MRAVPFCVRAGACVMQCAHERLQRSVTEKKKREGREWTCVCNGQFEQLKQAAAARGGEVVEEATASLDDVFVSRVKG